MLVTKRRGETIHLNTSSYLFVQGKSTLLKRIAARKIPGFPPHISSLLVQQEIFGHDELTPIDILLRNQETIQQQSKESNEYSISQVDPPISL